MKPEIATIHALRADVALQIARHAIQPRETQIAAAQRLQIPQPTLSKIMRGKVSGLSLELLIRIAVRARLRMDLQMSAEPAEAGAYVARDATSSPARLRSPVSEQARRELLEFARKLSPAERIAAHLRHSELVAALRDAGRRARVRR